MILLKVKPNKKVECTEHNWFIERDSLSGNKIQLLQTVDCRAFLFFPERIFIKLDLVGAL